MNEPTLQSLVDAARAYESLFVPALFGQWARKVGEAAQIKPGQRVLDVACGTGVLAREALARTGPTGQVSGLDPGPGMLTVARELAPAIDWRQGTAESLPFADQSFDRVVSQFGLMFFADRLQALREMLRVVRPGGRMVVAVWDSLENSPVYAAEVALLDRMAGAKAGEALRAPFVLGARQSLNALFEEAGAAAAEVTTHQGLGRFPSVRVLVEADLRGWLPVMGVNLSEEQISHILDEAERVLAPHVTGSGPITFPLGAHLVTVATT
jgi:SAM-dependent methyltransferase